MKRVLGVIIGLTGAFYAGYIGSYTARLGPADHISSRGLPLEKASDILQQDRANYYRFGVRDPEDSGCGWFRARAHRAAIGRMLPTASMPPELRNAIRHASPLVRVEVYDDHLEIRRAERTPKAHAAARPVPNPSADTVGTLRRVLTDDALRQLRTHARSDRLGFDTADLRHRPAGVYFAREGNRTVAWVVLASSPRKNFECHACMPTLSVFIYTQERAQAWRPVGKAYNAFRGGSGWDAEPSAEDMALVHIAPDRVALAIRSGYVNMGWANENYTLIGFNDTRAHTLLSTTMKENNGGTMDKERTNWTSTIRIRPGSGPFYDIHLHRKGILRSAPIDHNVTYRYDGHTYRPEQEDPVTAH